MRPSRFLWPAGLLLGAAAEHAAFAWGDAGHWLPDLLTGWTLLGCGLLAWQRYQSRSGVLLAATGAAWFLGNFSSSLAYLYRGPLIHLLLSYPDGRVRGRLTRFGVIAGYAASLVAPLWRSQTATIAISAALVIVAAERYWQAIGAERRAARFALGATAIVATAFAGTAAVRVAVPTDAATAATLVAYELALAAVASILVLGLRNAPWERPPLTNLVVDLAERRQGSLRAALARALGDPTLELAYPLGDGRGWVDATGAPVTLPARESARRVAYVERGGAVVAALVHDSSVPDDPGLTDALSGAAGLAAANARLHAEVNAHAAELRLSQQRLVRAADEERERIEGQLRSRTESRLIEALPAIEEARMLATQATAVDLDRAQAQLESTINDLRGLASGLRKRDITEHGLAEAIGTLVEHAPVPVRVDVAADRFPAEVEHAAYFVCAEALANIAKHANATQATVALAVTDARLRLEVADNGRGGAKPLRGSGLRGMADRVDALGGSLSIDSRPGRGTRLVAELPLGGLQG